MESKKEFFQNKYYVCLDVISFSSRTSSSLCFWATGNELLSGKFNNRQLLKGILQVHIFIAIFTLAVSINRGVKKSGGETPVILKNNKTEVQAGYLILLCALPFELYVNFVKLKFVANSGYASLYQELALNSIPSVAKILSYFFMPGCFYVFFASKNNSINERISLLLLAFHSVVELLIGYRAMAIIPVLLVLYGYSVKSANQGIEIEKKQKRRIFWLCILLAIVIMVIFPVVRATRNQGGIGMLTLSDILSIENNEIFSTINDMGKSLQTVIYTQDLVPEQYSYRYGITYLYNLSEAVPNLFWDRHPAEVYGSLGRWLTKIVDYSFYEFGGALGYSCVAESYINFGWVGVIVIAFILGMVIQKVENKVENSNVASVHASWVILANYLLMYPRGELSTIVRGFFWYMLIPFIFVKIIKTGGRFNVYRRSSNEKQT